MVCHNCQIRAKKHGKDRKGQQRWKCRPCRRTWTERYERLLGSMRISEDTAISALNLLCEGMGIRATSRVTGIHKTTLSKLLVYAGEACERFMAREIQGLAVGDVQIDETWGFIEMKERTKKLVGREDNALIGDAYCFTAIERDTKLLLAWHLGRRDYAHTDAFVAKLDRATEGRFQLTSDGWGAYPDTISYHLGTRTDYATLIKKFGYEEKQERRYSPPRIIGTDSQVIHGRPDPQRISTSHCERMNLSIRMQMRRMTRLTNCFSRKWENHKAAYALFFAFYNWCTMHSSIRMTPAMKAGICRRPWNMRDLLTAATH